MLCFRLLERFGAEFLFSKYASFADSQPPIHRNSNFEVETVKKTTHGDEDPGERGRASIIVKPIIALKYD